MSTIILGLREVNSGCVQSILYGWLGGNRAGRGPALD